MDEVGFQMDLQVFLNFIFGAVSLLFTFASFLAGWILNNITKSLDRLDADVRILPEVYIRRDDYKADLQRIEARIDSGFDRIFAKLDGKADKDS